MSALLAYIEEKRLVMASDSCVARSTDEFPKFQVVRTRKGPAFVGGVGWRSILARLFSPIQKICDEQGFTLANLQEFIPGAIDFMLKQRRPEDIDVERDIVAPPAQVLVGGFDDKADRMRLWLSIKNGVGTGTTIECAQHDFVSVGFFNPEDTPGLTELNATLKREARDFDAASIARILGARIDETAEKYPGNVGRAAFFAAVDDRGLIQLPSDLQAPYPISERAAVAR